MGGDGWDVGSDCLAIQKVEAFKCRRAFLLSEERRQLYDTIGMLYIEMYAIKRRNSSHVTYTFSRGVDTYWWNCLLHITHTSILHILYM